MKIFLSLCKKPVSVCPNEHWSLKTKLKVELPSNNVKHLYISNYLILVQVYFEFFKVQRPQENLLKSF